MIQEPKTQRWNNTEAAISQRKTQLGEGLRGENGYFSVLLELSRREMCSILTIKYLFYVYPNIGLGAFRGDDDS
jgi:hypothetical protein